MTPPGSFTPRPRSSSPAERGVVFAARQVQLKEEAAERRKLAESRAEPVSTKRPRTGRKTLGH
jgi:hypothetical protein